MPESPARHRLWPYWLLAGVGVTTAAALLAITMWRPAASAPHPATTIGAHLPVAVGAGPWQRLALPVPSADVNALVVAPDDPSTLVLCTANGAVTVWRTTDAGAHWARADVPSAKGQGCSLSAASDDPARLVLEVSSPDKQSSRCAGEVLWVSEDRGLSWHAAVAPSSPVPGASVAVFCGAQVTARTLFMLYSFNASPANRQVTLLERSDDGAHWARADGGLPPDALFTTLLAGPNDTLATLVLRPWTPQQPNPTALLLSTDGGQTWHVASHLPQPVGTFLLSAPPTGGAWPSPSRPFYALSQEQAPSDLYREGVYASADGQHWDALPALPVAGLSGVQRGILQVLAALPDGRLAVWGADPRAGVPSHVPVPDVQTRFWLWLWDPGPRQWQVVPAPLAATHEEGCGLCWQAAASADRSGTTSLYAWSFVASGPDAPAGLFRMRLPRGA